MLQKRGRADPAPFQPGRRPRYSMFPGLWTSRPALIFRVTRGKYSPCDAVKRGALVCGEDLNFIPAINDHEEGLTRPAWRRNVGLVVTGAIGVHCIGAF